MAKTKQFKSLIIKKLGWKRVAKNVMRFGWELDDAVEHHDTTVTTSYEGRVVGDTVYVDEHKDEKTKVRVHLDFHRDRSKFANLGAIFVFELFYNIFFYLRRLIGFCLPILLLGSLVVAMVDAQSELGGNLGILLCSLFCAWLGLIALEGIFARIAHAILKLK